MYECRRLGLTPVSYLNYNVLIYPTVYTPHAAVLYGFRFGLLFPSRDCPGASDDGSKSVKAVVNLHVNSLYKDERDRT